MKPPRAYPPRIAELLARERLAPLDAGTPVEEVRPALASLTPAAAFAPHAVRDEGMAAACLAGLWLRFDFLDESHRISQEIETPTGSFWHGILHRREGDYGNAKYWFRRVGTHPVYEVLAKDAAEQGYLGMGMRWDPFVFVDSCAEYAGAGTAEEETCRRVQRAEWELLFAWCYGRAVAE